MSPTCGVADAVGELVDDQPILIRERRRHALAFDARDLEAERDDQRGVDRGRGQRLQPGEQLFADAAGDRGPLARHQRWSAELGRLGRRNSDGGMSRGAPPIGSSPRVPIVVSARSAHRRRPRDRSGRQPARRSTMVAGGLRVGRSTRAARVQARSASPSPPRRLVATARWLGRHERLRRRAAASRIVGGRRLERESSFVSLIASGIREAASFAIG